MSENQQMDSNVTEIFENIIDETRKIIYILVTGSLKGLFSIFAIDTNSFDFIRVKDIISPKINYIDESIIKKYIDDLDASDTNNEEDRIITIEQINKREKTFTFRINCEIILDFCVFIPKNFPQIEEFFDYNSKTLDLQKLQEVLNNTEENITEADYSVKVSTNSMKGVIEIVTSNITSDMSSEEIVDILNNVIFSESTGNYQKISNIMQ